MGRCPRAASLVRLVILPLCALLITAIAVAEAPAPREVVVQASERMLAALRADRDLVKKDSQHVYELVEEILLPHFDFEAMSKWVLGKYWRTLSKEQAARFTSEFRTLLVRTYAVSLADYKDQAYEVLPETRGGEDQDHAIVRSEIKIKGPYPVPINYSMHRKQGVWMVYDVSFDGVSLVANYRTSFTTEIRHGGPDMLINKLASLNRNQTQ